MAKATTPPKKTTTAQANGYLKRHKEELGLQEWVVAFELVPANAVGGFKDEDGLANAWIRFDIELMESHLRLASHRPPSEVEEAVVHELLHLVFAELTDSMDRTCHRLSTEAGELAMDGFKIQEHQAILRIVNAILGPEHGD